MTGAESVLSDVATISIPPQVYDVGTRNDILYRTTRSVHAKYGLNANEILNLLRGINQTRCKPPVDQNGISKIANNAATLADPPDCKTGAAVDPHVARLAAMYPRNYDGARKADANRLGD